MATTTVSRHKRAVVGKLTDGPRLSSNFFQLGEHTLESNLTREAMHTAARHVNYLVFLVVSQFARELLNFLGEKIQTETLPSSWMPRVGLEPTR